MMEENETTPSLPADSPLRPPSPPPLPSQRQLRMRQSQTVSPKPSNSEIETPISTNLVLSSNENHILVTTPTSEKPYLPQGTLKDHRLKRTLPNKLLQIANSLEAQPPFSLMGCTESKVDRFSNRDNPLRHRKTDFRTAKLLPKKTKRTWTSSSEDYNPEELTVVRQNHSVDLSRDQRPSASDHDTMSTISMPTLNAPDFLRNFEVIQFSKLQLHGDSLLDMRIVLMNGRLPFIYSDVRLNFLHHFHQSLYQVHLQKYNDTKTYPTSDILRIIEKELISFDRYHRSAVLSASSPMAMFCLKETFSFSKRKVKKNSFSFPIIIEGHSFNSNTFHRVMKCLHDEYEALWRSTFRGAVTPAFS